MLRTTTVLLISTTLMSCSWIKNDEHQDSKVYLEDIQKEIFSPYCASCHKGTLDNVENSYNYLIDKPSKVKTELSLVKPGNPENSYLLWKIEGRTMIIGQQMPLNDQKLSSKEIERLKKWIADT